MPLISVALTTSPRNCRPDAADGPQLISTLPVACGLVVAIGATGPAGRSAADPGAGCDAGSVVDPAEDTAPGVGESVEESCDAGEVESVLVDVPPSVGVGLPPSVGVPPVEGVPDGVVLGVAVGEHEAVPVGSGTPPPPPCLPPDCPDGPTGPLPEDVKPGVRGCFGWWELVGPGGLTDPPVRPFGAIAAGSAATAQDAAVTTNRPVPTAAAGRSQPNHPARLGSGRNRSATAAATAGSQPLGGRNDRHHGSPAARTPKRHFARPAWLAMILLRILARPSSPGSTDSAAANRAARSALSCSAL